MIKIMEDTVEVLIMKSGTTNSSAEALHYSQAALNAANVYLALYEVQLIKAADNRQ